MSLPDGLEPGECRSCKAPIYWATRVDGRRIPLDRGAETRFEMRGGEAHQVRVFQTHFVTCPDRDKWRKPQPSLPGTQPRPKPR